MKENPFAVKALVRSKDKILLLLKTESESNSDGESNRLDLPGGRVLQNENFFKAITREIKEETALSVYDIKELFRETATKANGEALVFIYYECFTDDTAVILSDEHEHYFWKSDKEILKDSSIPDWIKALI